MAKKRRINPLGGGPILAVLGLALGGGLVYAITQMPDRKKAAKKKPKAPVIPPEEVLEQGFPFPAKYRFPTGITVSPTCGELTQFNSKVFHKQLKVYLEKIVAAAVRRSGLTRAELIQEWQQGSALMQILSVIDLTTLYMGQGTGTHQCVAPGIAITDKNVAFSEALTMFLSFWISQVMSENDLFSDQPLLMFLMLVTSEEDEIGHMTLEELADAGFPIEDIQAAYEAHAEEVEALREEQGPEVMDAMFEAMGA